MDWATTWEASLNDCKLRNQHRLYHAMKIPCPCMRWIHVDVIPQFLTPTISLDDIKKRRFGIIDRNGTVA